MNDFLKKADVLLSPRIFANKCADLFEFVVKNTDELVDFFYEHPIDLALSSEREKKKFELYVASKYLEYVSLVPEEVKQDYLYYVSNYFLELGNNLDEDGRNFPVSPHSSCLSNQSSCKTSGISHRVESRTFR